jgi:hypothetical protein
MILKTVIALLVTCSLFFGYAPCEVDAAGSSFKKSLVRNRAKAQAKDPKRFGKKKYIYVDDKAFDKQVNAQKGRNRSVGVVKMGRNSPRNTEVVIDLKKKHVVRSRPGKKPIKLRLGGITMGKGSAAKRNRVKSNIYIKDIQVK